MFHNREIRETPDCEMSVYVSIRDEECPLKIMTLQVKVIIHRSHLKIPVRQFKWLLILNQKGVEIFWYLLIREQDDTERMIVEVEGWKKVKEAQRRNYCVPKFILVINVVSKLTCKYNAIEFCSHLQQPVPGTTVREDTTLRRCNKLLFKGKLVHMAGKLSIPATKPIPSTTNRILRDEKEEEEEEEKAGEHLLGAEGTTGVN
ncbi:hypothetical protein C0J52_20145 [Blattella germanica]|nr:hypothetical protein C0J52_20145 [Blattella germanica]